MIPNTLLKCLSVVYVFKILFHYLFNVYRQSKFWSCPCYLTPNIKHGGGIHTPEYGVIHKIFFVPRAESTMAAIVRAYAWCVVLPSESCGQQEYACAVVCIGVTVAITAFPERSRVFIVLILDSWGKSDSNLILSSGWWEIWTERTIVSPPISYSALCLVIKALNFMSKPEGTQHIYSSNTCSTNLFGRSALTDPSRLANSSWRRSSSIRLLLALVSTYVVNQTASSCIKNNQSIIPRTRMTAILN